MPDMLFTDRASVSGTRRTEEGYLIADAFAVRTGIQLYSGKEVDPNNDHGLRDKAVVRVYRSEKEVRDVSSLRSFSHAPITIGHPAEDVTAANWKDLAVGEVSTEAVWQDNKIRIPLILKDQEANNLVEGGVRELSAGYRCKLDINPGLTEDGKPFDAQQTDIRINHIAIVPRGRAGAECRIGDSADSWGAKPLSTIDNQEVPMSTKVVVMGDKAVHVAADDAPTVEAHIASLNARIAQMQKDHDTALGAKDAEITTANEKIADLQSKVLTDAQIADKAAARAKLLDAASKVAPGIQLDSALSDADIRRAVLAKRLGDASVKDKSDDYVQGVFDSLASSSAPVRTQDSVVAPHRPL